MPHVPLTGRVATPPKAMLPPHQPRPRARVRPAPAARPRVKPAKPPAQRRRPKPAPFNPLAPLAGKTWQQEVNAQTQLQYGGQERDLADQLRQNTASEVNTGGYYDQYKAALDAANARIAAVQTGAANATQQQTDAAYQQDAARQNELNAQQAQQAQLYGRPASPSAEGAQAVTAAHSAGELAAGRMREHGATEQTYGQRLGANSVLAKAEAIQRVRTDRGQLLKKRGQLKSDEGAFKVAQRAKAREGERTYALAAKEFGLKRQDILLKAKATKGQQATDRMKARTQKMIAQIYAQADQAKAAATVRVARLNLKKGKIDQHQYRQIVNIYKGLPKKGQSGGARSSSGASGTRGQGSGPGGTWAPWERDKISTSVRSLRAAKATAGEKQAMIDKLVKAGIPERLARAAWRHYIKSITVRNVGLGSAVGSTRNPRGALG